MDRLTELTQKLRSKTATDAEANEIIESLVPLVLRIVKQFATGQNWRHAAELESKALYMLTYVVKTRAADKLTNDDITRYISGWTWRTLENHVQRHTDPADQDEHPERFCLDPDNDFVDSLTGTDREIVILRLQGYTDAEVGQRLGKSQAWVHGERAKIGRKYDLLEETAHSKERRDPGREYFAQLKRGPEGAAATSSRTVQDDPVPAAHEMHGAP